MAITQVIFDVGGVLVDWRARKTLSQLYGAQKADELMQVVFATPLWQEEIDLGHWSPGEILAALAQQTPSLSQEILAIQKQMDCFAPPIPEMLPLVVRLKQQGFGLYYLSNYAWEPFQHLLGACPALGYMDGGVVSSQVHAVKPEQAIYQALLERYNLDPRTCVFVDDHPQNLEPARRLGMAAVAHRDVDALEQELKRLGLVF